MATVAVRNKVLAIAMPDLVVICHSMVTMCAAYFDSELLKLKPVVFMGVVNRFFDLADRR